MTFAICLVHIDPCTNIACAHSVIVRAAASAAAEFQTYQFMAFGAPSATQEILRFLFPGQDIKPPGENTGLIASEDLVARKHTDGRTVDGKPFIIEPLLLIQLRGHEAQPFNPWARDHGLPQRMGAQMVICELSTAHGRCGVIGVAQSIHLAHGGVFTVLSVHEVLREDDQIMVLARARAFETDQRCIDLFNTCNAQGLRTLFEVIVPQLEERSIADRKTIDRLSREKHERQEREAPVLPQLQERFIERMRRDAEEHMQQSRSILAATHDWLLEQIRTINQQMVRCITDGLRRMS